MMTVIEQRFMDAAISFFRKSKSKKEKRAEIAANVLPSVVSRYTEADEEVAAKIAIKFADALIKELGEDGEE